MKKDKTGISIDKVNLTGSINLSMGHSLVLGNIPRVVKPEDLSKILIEDSSSDILSFGLFETASPNYTTYYPEVTAEDLKPKDDDFITPVFRMLSETIVSKYAPIDFSDEGVLKKSMRLLLGQTINIDHEMAVGNAIGSVAAVYWQESYKSKGIVVPAGINAMLKIDGKSNPRIARGIMMEPPSIHSNSVTVNFKWKPSHTFEDMSDFYYALGTYNKEGELVRLIVEDIIAYHETSLVSHGADAFAQKVDSNNEIVNPGYAKSVYKFSAEKPTDVKAMMDYKNSMLTLSAKTSIPLNTNKNNNLNIKSMDEIIKELAAKFKLDVAELNEDNLVEKLSSILDARDTQVTTLTDANTTLKQEVSDLKTAKGTLETEKGTLETANGKFNDLLKATRDEASRLYKLCKGDKFEPSILKLIEEANVETAASFVRQYQAEADEKHPLTCQSCKSQDIQRKSSVTSKEGTVDNNGNPINNGGDGGNGSQPKDNVEVLNNIKEKANRNKKRISLYEVSDDE